MELQWSCMEPGCEATGPMDDTAIWDPHDCRSKGPFDEVSALMVHEAGERW